MRHTVLIFGALATTLLLLFRIGRYSVFSGDVRTEVLLSVTALVFLCLGFYLRRPSSLPEPVSEKQTPPPDTDKLAELSISPREYEVLELIASGLSNREIGQQLFLSESTIKTHVSSLLSKLNAKRRTQAVERARSLQLI